MKLLPDNLSRKAAIRVATVHAYTIIEVFIVATIFIMVVMGILSLQIFGLKMNAFTSSELMSTAYGLKALNQIRDQVRGACAADVGNQSGSSFTVTTTNGNALKINLTANLNNYILFYLDTNTTKLYRVDVNNGVTNSLMIATNVVNQTTSPVFQKEDCQGNFITNSLSTEHRTIRMTLNFSRVAYTLPANVSDSYTLQTIATPRNIVY
jgi:hypothetical protein